MSNQQITYNRAKVWQIAFFALNNTATNIFYFLMMYVSYYANGVAGIAVVTISFLLTAMRIFDGVTDPLIGFFIDKTSTKFGKFRPSIMIGYTIIVASILILFNTLHTVPESFRVIYFVLVYGLYIIGYTFQTACTKAAQACLTNDPKQRPLFTLFDGIYNTLLFTGISIYVSNYLVPKYGDFTDALFIEFSTTALIASGIFTTFALIGISAKDRPEFFGLGQEGPKIEFKDYIEVIKGNRAIQMLIVAASTDKLAGGTMSNSTVAVIIFGVLAGNYGLSGQLSGFTTLPILLFLMMGVRYATKLGQKKALILTTWGSLIFAIALAALILVGDMTTLSFQNMNLFTMMFCGIYIIMKGVSGVSSAIVIPMIADCADYETYRSGKYIPGMMGTLFSFIDKLISSLATTVVGLVLAGIGFVDLLPTVDTVATTELLYAGVFLYLGMPMIGWIASLIAMKFYPLDAEKMNEIQEEIQRIKNQDKEKIA